MLIQQQAKLLSLSAAQPDCRRGRGGVSGKAFFRIKAVPETTALTGPDPAQLHTYTDGMHQLGEIPTNIIWRGKGSGFS